MVRKLKNHNSKLEELNKKLEEGKAKIKELEEKIGIKKELKRTNSKYKLNKLTSIAKKESQIDENQELTDFSDIQDFEDLYVVIDIKNDEEARADYKAGKFNFYVEQLLKSEVNQPKIKKFEYYDKSFLLRIGDTEQKIINYLKNEKGQNISQLIREYILSLGKEIANDEFIASYNKLVEEYNTNLKYIKNYQEYRKKIEGLRGVNKKSAVILATRRTYIAYKIKYLKSKVKKQLEQLQKMENILK